MKILILHIFFQLYAASHIQQGRQKEPSVKILPTFRQIFEILCGAIHCRAMSFPEQSN